MNKILKEYICEVFRGDFNYNRYFVYRHALFNPKLNKIKRTYYNWYINHVNNKFGASITHTVSRPDNFKTPPILPHGILGVVMSSDAIIGKNCIISQQVTIGASEGGSPIVGDNVYFAPGAKAFGNIHIENNVRIGANCVVFKDIPDNATVVLEKPRVIVKSKDYHYVIRSEGEFELHKWSSNGKIKYLSDKGVRNYEINEYL